MGKRDIILPTLNFSMGKRNIILPTLTYSIRLWLIQIDYPLMVGKFLSFFPTASILKWMGIKRVSFPL